MDKLELTGCCNESGGEPAEVGAPGAARLRVAEDVDLVWRLIADGHRVRYERT